MENIYYPFRLKKNEPNFKINQSICDIFPIYNWQLHMKISSKISNGKTLGFLLCKKVQLA